MRLRYKDKRLQEMYEAFLKLDKDRMFKPGGAIQHSWKRGYEGRKPSPERTSIAGVAWLAGKDRSETDG